MNHSARGFTLTLLAILTIAGRQGAGQAQAAPPIDHGKRIFQQLRDEKFDDVAKEFNAQVAAALTAAQLRQVWSTLSQQVGPFKSLIDERVATPAPGTTAVILGCQFENAALNFIVAFDGENKISGLRFAPRPAPSEPPATPPRSSKFKDEPVTIGAGEWALPGTLSIPPGRNLAAVVLVHGSGPNDRDETIGPNKPFRDLAWGLADRGIAVLRYDKRTRVYGAKIAGNKNLTVRDETIDDALLAATLLRGRPEIDPKRVFILGHSLGGMVAPRIGADDPSLAGLIIMAGATRPLRDVAHEQLEYIASLTPGSVNPDQGLQKLIQSAPESYWKDLDSNPPAQAAAKLKMRMLILQGERDYQVSQADLKGWRDALSDRKDVTIKSYPTLNHLFMVGTGKSTPSEYQQAGHVADFVLDDIAGWIGKN